MYRVQTNLWGISLSNIRIIKTVRDAREALSLLAQRKFEDELAAIHRAAQNMSQGKAGAAVREQAIRAVLIGFSDNVEPLELDS